MDTPSTHPLVSIHALYDRLCSLKSAFHEKNVCRMMCNQYFEPTSCIPWAPLVSLEDFIDYCAQKQPHDNEDFLLVFQHFLAPPSITSQNLEAYFKVFKLNASFFQNAIVREFFLKLFTTVLFPLERQSERDEVEALLCNSGSFDPLLNRLYQIYKIESSPGELKRNTNYRELLSAPYVSKGADTLRFFATYLKQCSMCETDYFEGKETTYSFPYVALCQRSGSGKTRLMLEMGRRFFPEIYVCLKGGLSPERITGHLNSLKVDPPEANEDPEVTFQRFEAARTKARYLLVAMYYYTIKKMAEPLSSKNEFLKKFEPDIVGSVAESCWKEILEMAEEHGQILEDQFVNDQNPCPHGLVLFSFDEASSLLPSDNVTMANDANAKRAIARSAFSVLRFAAYQLQMNRPRKFVMIFADTQSKISNFTKNHEVSDSSPIRDNLHSEPVPAFFALSSADINAKHDLITIKGMIEEESNGVYKWKDYLNAREKNTRHFYSFGSPLWVDFCKTGNTSELDVLNYTSSKLLAYLPEIYKDIASLACRSVITICPKSQLPVDLVSRSLYQIDYFTMDKSAIYTHFPSDPTVAAAASNYQEQKGCQALKSLKAHVSNAEVDVGDVGETMAQFILLSAIDYLIRENAGSIFKSVCLSKFLQLILGVESNGDLRELGLENDVLKGSLLFFNHFFGLDGPIKYENLHFAAGRGAALLGFHNQEAFDIFIPFVRSNGVLSCLLIQIKNYRDAYSVDNDEAKRMNTFLERLRPALTSALRNEMDALIIDSSKRAATNEATISAPAKRAARERAEAALTELCPTCHHAMPEHAAPSDSVKIIINLRQGHLITKDKAFEAKPGIIMVPCMQEKWKQFLWSPGDKTFEVIQGFLFDDMEHKCRTERTKPFVEHIVESNHWDKETICNTNPIISATVGDSTEDIELASDVEVDRLMDVDEVD